MSLICDLNTLDDDNFLDCIIKDFYPFLEKLIEENTIMDNCLETILYKLKNIHSCYNYNGIIDKLKELNDNIAIYINQLIQFVNMNHFNIGYSINGSLTTNKKNYMVSTNKYSLFIYTLTSTFMYDFKKDIFQMYFYLCELENKDSCYECIPEFKEYKQMIFNLMNKIHIKNVINRNINEKKRYNLNLNINQKNKIKY